MKPVIVYPLPIDDWTTFRPFAIRFTDTFRRYQPGTECVICGVFNWGRPEQVITDLFIGLEALWMIYNGHGCDAGSWQRAASKVRGFLVCCTSRVYFHRDGWLAEIVKARERYGPGIYSTSASKDIAPHLCCRCFGIDSELLHSYPVRIERRGVVGELEAGNCGWKALWWHVVESGGVAKAVYGNGAFDQEHWFDQPNTFRKGDQSNLLVWDKHSDEWRYAPPAERDRLGKLSDDCACQGSTGD